ncbi:hypothetical protein EK21DRAFT_92399 [Setomelanomma holmii]|uniref:Protein kinase domain-containing protein n=1 Tax=Setomelanomma holmii TaxID=210430 RepID=A0A9P4H4E3_9PLEO|nr:hypothetical protein EK21DRAFT_92399 [Setomelanomma holmii]
MPPVSNVQGGLEPQELDLEAICRRHRIHPLEILWLGVNNVCRTIGIDDPEGLRQLHRSYVTRQYCVQQGHAFFVTTNLRITPPPPPRRPQNSNISSDSSSSSSSSGPSLCAPSFSARPRAPPGLPVPKTLNTAALSTPKLLDHWNKQHYNIVQFYQSSRQTPDADVVPTVRFLLADSTTGDMFTGVSSRPLDYFKAVAATGIITEDFRFDGEMILPFCAQQRYFPKVDQPNDAPSRPAKRFEGDIRSDALWVKWHCPLTEEQEEFPEFPIQNGFNLQRRLAKRPPHPNLPEYHGAVVAQHGRVVTLVYRRYDMTLAEFSTTSYWKNDRERERYATDIFRMVEAAMRYLHSFLIIHRYIQPRNVLLSFRMKVGSEACRITLKEFARAQRHVPSAILELDEVVLGGFDFATLSRPGISSLFGFECLEDKIALESLGLWMGLTGYPRKVTCGKSAHGMCRNLRLYGRCE